MNWRDITALYRTELGASLRERTIVVNSLLIPLLLYPVMLWVMFTGLTVIQSQGERLEVEVLLVDLPAQHEELAERLAELERVTIERQDGDRDAARRAVEEGELEAALLYDAQATAAADDGESLVGNGTFELTLDSSSERSRAAARRVERVLDGYRAEFLGSSATARGLKPQELVGFASESEDHASAREVGNFMLGLMLPIMFVIMVAVGCFYPAIDTTAGERERGTWETTMTLATSRINIVAAKYLIVATFGCVAGVLNVAALVISMRSIMAPLLGDRAGSVSFSLPWSSLPLLLVVALLLGGLIAACMMILASFARTFREGQSMITPFYLILILPALFLNDPGLEFTPRLALVPVVNLALVVRAAFLGDLQLVQTALAIATSLLAIGLVLWLSTKLLRDESVVVGSFKGGFIDFVRQRLLRRTAE